MRFYLALLVALLVGTFNRVALAVPVESFQSNGKAIRLEWFPPLSQPNPKTKKPLLLILHGSGRLDDKGGFFRDIAAELAKRGHNTVVVHYFDQTGNKLCKWCRHGSLFFSLDAHHRRCSWIL
jgi:predicted alpha/beta-fold hydrolase